MTLDDQFDDVFDRAQAGEETAWRALIDDLGGPLLGYLRARGAADPEGRLGDVYLDLARHVQGFSGNEHAFRGWVFLMARHRIVDERRARARRPDPVADDVPADFQRSDDEGVEDRVLAALEQDWVHAVLDELTDDQRDVILLRVIADLSLEETARALGKRVGAVKQLQRRAVLTLRWRLGESGDATATAGEVIRP